MLVKIFLIFLLGFVLEVFYMHYKMTKHHTVALILKTSASLCFVTISFLLFKNLDEPNDYLLFSGAICGIIGDILLALRMFGKKVKSICFIIGSLFFMTGHIIYIRYVLTLYDNFFIPLIISCLLLVVLFIVLIKKIKANMIYKVVGTIYVFVILFLSSLSIGAAISIDKEFIRIFMVGALLFSLSDILLIICKFVLNKTTYLDKAYLIFYYLGQTFIAFSMYYF